MKPVVTILSVFVYLCFGVKHSTKVGELRSGSSGPYNYQKALYTGKHFDLPKSTEKTYAWRGLYALWITILCLLKNQDVYMWQIKVYDPKT